MHSLFEANKDDAIIAESGFQLFDLVPSVKLGPLGKINVTFDSCLFKNNYGGKKKIKFISCFIYPQKSVIKHHKVLLK